MSWSLQRGATLLEQGGVRFTVWAPGVRELSVRLLRDGTAWAEQPLARSAGGLFEGLVAAAAAGTDYVYVLDGRPLPDPVSRHQPQGVHGPSRVVDPRAFAWTDEAWTGLEMAELSLYELHVGTFTGRGTFEALAAQLGYLRELGVTALELMPVAEFPGTRNWGYDGVHPYAPHSAYGGPEGLRRLVDAAHAAGLAVVLDVVYNHLGPEGNYLGQYGPYFTDRYRTPWGQSLNFDGPHSDEVRRYFIDNALYWVTEFHLDGLRLDAVHSIYDFGAQHLIEELAAAVRAQAAALGRRVQVIAESDLNDPRLLRPRELGGYGLDAQWNDDFHHALHAVLTGETNGYYADFGGVAPLIKALEERFVYAGCFSRHRQRRHGAPARDVPAQRFVVCIQNHDQVGNRACGERLTELASFPQLKLAAALLLLSPYVPMLFMGEEYGETSPFLYFVSHGDPALVEAVRAGRRREFREFHGQAEVPDPQDERTFERSRLKPELREQGWHAQLLGLYRDLLRLRRQEPALRPGAASVHVECEQQAGWFAMTLDAEEGADLLLIANLDPEPRQVELKLRSRRFRRILSTDESRYGGRLAQASPQTAAGTVEDGELFDVAGQTAALYRSEVD